MYSTEFRQIKEAVEHYSAANSQIERLQQLRADLERHRKQDELLKLSIIGNSSTYDLSKPLIAKLFVWLDEQIGREISELASYQNRIVCPAGTRRGE